MDNKLIDHLFRHHYGKMVSVLTRIFGLSNLEIIEDAVQDTFIKATTSWKQNIPEHPEAWLTTAAKNRVLDIFRKLKAEKRRVPQFVSGMDAIAINDLFLDTEIEDSQLRMIFTACHPLLSPTDRIASALKSVSGFSSKEISSSLLTKEDTINKRLVRARKTIRDKEIPFSIPTGNALVERLNSVHEVLYLIFNEGFHSNNTEFLIRKELCAEAMRLIQMVLNNKITRSPDGYALFALMCFHAARLDSKLTEDGDIIDLKHQDRSQWHFPLIRLGNDVMIKAVENDEYSAYHYEAAIAAEHLRARKFESTDWVKILMWLEKLYEISPSPFTSLNIAVVLLQMGSLEKAYDRLLTIEPAHLEQRSYLYYGFLSEYYLLKEEKDKAISSISLALTTVANEAEKRYLLNKKKYIQTQ